MKILAVPNWSFFDPELCFTGVRRSCSNVFVHYAKGDEDHGRTVTAFSGDSEKVFEAMKSLCLEFLPSIDLTLGGVHPFSGALDVAPFVLLDGSEAELIAEVRTWAEAFNDEFSIPVHLYEKAAFPGKEVRLPVLRGQFGPTSIPFDFGVEVHRTWGYSAIGVRDFLLAVNLNFSQACLGTVRRVAKEIRLLREAGDPIFAGVRSLAFDLKVQQFAQLSLNMTLPDHTRFDDLCLWVTAQMGDPYETELIGVIRDVDLPKSTRLSPKPEQIVPTL